jgi:uncharacterized repeat protein (TIGR01451 family)
MYLRGRRVGVALVLLAELGLALALGAGAASADPKRSPFRTAQVTGPSSPEPPLADGAVPPVPAPTPCPPTAPPVAPPVGTPCPVDPPTPAVAIRVRVPASAAAGQELEYRLCVENTSQAAAHHVTVRNPLPVHARFVRATPKPAETEPELTWRLGTLEAGACREIVLVLSPTGTGDVKDCARVTFEHGQCVTTRITRPQLSVRKSGPSQASVGEALTFRIEVSNTGAAEATDVRLVETLQAGWQYEQEPYENKQIQKTWRLGTLAPGESRSVEYRATPRVNGELKTSAEASAAGGLLSNVERHTVTVGTRGLTLEIDGPRKTYARRTVTFDLTVRNEGSLPAANVVVTDSLPEGLEFVGANQGGRYADGSVRWSLGTVPAGQSRTLQLRVRSPLAHDELVQRPVATAEGGLKGSTEIATKFEGAGSFDFGVDPSEDAVEVDTPVRYTVRVWNDGSADQTNVRIEVEVPPEMEFKEATAPDGLKFKIDKGRVVFDPLPALRPGKEEKYEVVAVARKPGDARVRVGMGAGGAERLAFKTAATTIGEKQPP